VGERVPASVAHLPELGLLAALRDEVAERLIFHGREDGQHQLLYHVRRADDQGSWTITPARPPMTGRLHERPGRCPAPDILPPVSARQKADLAAFLSVIEGLTGGRRPIALTRAGISAADAVAAFAVGVRYQLCRHGVIGEGRPAPRSGRFRKWVAFTSGNTATRSSLMSVGRSTGKHAEHPSRLGPPDRTAGEQTDRRGDDEHGCPGHRP
jgi:hypothetical protein